MNDEKLKSRIRYAWSETAAKAPDFDALWDAAEARAGRRAPVRAIAAGIALIVAATVALNMRPAAVTDGDGLLVDEAMEIWAADIDSALLNGTAWAAPSDTLLPIEEPALYDTLPSIVDPTEMEVETLL